MADVWDTNCSQPSCLGIGYRGNALLLFQGGTHGPRLMKLQRPSQPMPTTTPPRRSQGIATT